MRVDAVSLQFGSLSVLRSNSVHFRGSVCNVISDFDVKINMEH